jgi:hypothetical protein
MPALYPMLELRAPDTLRIGLGQHEPIATKYEPPERDFSFGLITVWPLLGDGALARYRHAKLNRLFSALYISA